MSVLSQLTIRDKELVIGFRRYCQQQGLQVWSSDDFRDFLVKKDIEKNLKDTKKNVNIGGIIANMLRARNPLHKSERVGYKVSELTRNKKREVKTFRFTK